ncbi:discoidin domain-containing protein, partial [Nonomuraea sp. MG754425]|nr:discoidin domain-containing protein [Nonomuraea sp. MG754425]
MVVAALAALVLVLSGLVPATPARAADILLSQNRPATASSSEGAAWGAAAAFDGDRTGTRWSSLFSDPQWLQVDLGASATISRVVLDWENAYAKAFTIQTS